VSAQKQKTYNVDDGQFKREPDTVEDVVLPADLAQRNRIDVLVEEEGNVDREPDNRHALCADVVGQDLDRVADKQPRPRQVVECVVDIDHADDAVCRRLVPGDGVAGGADGPDDEGGEHAGCGDEEERATADFVDEETHCHCDDAVPDGEDAVDDVLGGGVGVAYLVEDDVEVVGDEAVAGPLGEEARGDADDHAVAVALCADEFEPAVALVLLLELDGVDDFLHFEDDDFVVHVAVGVGVGDDVVRLFLLAVGDEPARGFGDEVDGAELDHRGESLHDGGDSPCPVAGDLESAESQPGGDDGTSVPHGVVDGGEDGAVLRVYELGDEERRRTVRNGDTESDEETSGNEHGDVDGDGLKDDTDDHDDAADEDTRSTTEDISGVWYSGNGGKRTNGHDGV